METYSSLLAIFALMFSLICVWINGWVNSDGAGDLRRYRVHYDVIVMFIAYIIEARMRSIRRTTV